MPRPSTCLFSARISSPSCPRSSAHSRRNSFLFSTTNSRRKCRGSRQTAGASYMLSKPRKKQRVRCCLALARTDLTHTRGCPSAILLSTHPPADLFPFKHHLARPHQARPHPGSPRASRYPATYTKLVWRGGDAVRGPACRGKLRRQAVVRCVCRGPWRWQGRRQQNG